jgi:hypothetical protein
MTPTEIVHFEHEKKFNATQKDVVNSKNQQTIKLKNPSLLATKSDLDELHSSAGLCYALVCKNALYSIGDTSIALSPAVANLLQEYMDVFPSEIPPGFVRALCLVLFLFLFFLRKMALGACVLIVEPLITSQFSTDILFLDWMTCLMN